MFTGWNFGKHSEIKGIQYACPLKPSGGCIIKPLSFRIAQWGIGKYNLSGMLALQSDQTRKVKKTNQLISCDKKF